MAAKPPAAAPPKTPVPPFQMAIEPEGKILFKGKLGDTITVERKLTNTTADRQCYKIKCTANSIFRVKQPLGFVEPNVIGDNDETNTAFLQAYITVQFIFIGKTMPESNKHFFAFYNVKFDEVTGAGRNPRQVWNVETKPSGLTRILAQFELAKEVAKPEEKK